MSAPLSATEALLACAAAETTEEFHAARLALIANGVGMLSDVDRSALVSGDGTAGRYLLGGTGFVPADGCARRSMRLQVRLLARLARPTAEVTR